MQGDISVGPEGTDKEEAKPLSVMLKKPWQLGEVPKDKRRVNIISIFARGEKEDSGPVSLTSVPGRI